MKDQILAKLVTKYPGLSKKFLGLLADQLAKKVTEESGIDAAIADLDNAPIPVSELAAEFQKEGDRRVNEAKKEFLKNPPKPDKTEEPPKTEQPPTDDTPPWAKALMQEVASLKAEKSRSTIQQTIAAKLKDKEGKELVPQKFYSKRVLPEKEEDIDAFIEEVKADYTDLMQGKVDEALASSSTRPVNGTPSGGDKKQATKEELDEVIKNIM